MKPLATFVLLIALAVSAFAQDAHVIQLSEKDATEAQRLYKQMVDSREAYAKFTGDITTRYTMDANGHPTRAEWTSGWRFDQTFKFIVPGLPFLPGIRGVVYGGGITSVCGSCGQLCACTACTTLTPTTPTPYTTYTTLPYATTVTLPSSTTLETITLEGKRKR